MRGDPSAFCYWLRGYTEITNGAQPDATQWQIIQDHLNEVFTKVTPNRHDPTLPKDQTTYCGGVRSFLRPYDPDEPIKLSATYITC